MSWVVEELHMADCSLSDAPRTDYNFGRLAAVDRVPVLLPSGLVAVTSTLQWLPHLRILDLSKNRIGEAGAVALQQQLKAHTRSVHRAAATTMLQCTPTVDLTGARIRCPHCI